MQLVASPSVHLALRMILLQKINERAYYLLLIVTYELQKAKKQAQELWQELANSKPFGSSFCPFALSLRNPMP